MSPSSQPEGELIPPQPPPYGEQPAHPLPDYEREVSHPNSRDQGWNVLRTPGTYFLLSINIAVFLWMLFHGVDPRVPTSDQLLHYGATRPDLIFHGQWYRLLTATFVHVGLIHIATNMWCLWNLGLLGEPLLGPFGLVAVYMLTGIAGNLLSLGINVVVFRDFASVGAGASGAVFGIAGILIVLLSNHKLPIPIYELKRLRRSVIQFAALNLIIGLSTTILPVGIRIDNGAHLGGFLSGLSLGVPLVPRMTSGRVRYLKRQKLTFSLAAFFLILFGYFVAIIR